MWNFYTLLTCTTVVDEDKIIIIFSFPLLDSSDDREIFKIHNLPVPVHSEDTSSSDPTKMVAQYLLEADAIAVNTRRTKYALLTADELESCSKPLVGFCSIKSPVYPINLGQFCIIALLMRNEERITENCQTLVKPNAVLPMAAYLTNCLWLITTSSDLIVSVVCHNTDRGQSEIEITPPL